MIAITQPLWTRVIRQRGRLRPEKISQVATSLPKVA